MAQTAVVQASSVPRMRSKAVSGPRVKTSALVMILYLLFLLLPIYWLFNMSLKENSEILSSFSLWPQNPTLGNYGTKASPVSSGAT